MNIDSLAVNPGPAIYYENKFRIVLENHITWLKSISSTRMMSVDAQSLYKYEGDFFGLLASYNIVPHLHWIIMRMNGLVSPMDKFNDINSLLIPDNADIDLIRQSYVSTNRIKN